MHVHGWEKRTPWHPDGCHFKTMLDAEVLTVMCPEHVGRVVAAPWAEKYDRFTKLFERLAIEVLKERSMATEASRRPWTPTGDNCPRNSGKRSRPLS